ncbi:MULTISPECIES: phosphoribosyl-AMP cyclohydrolase [Henriciella]|jgi:phosphoribosyl-AMP cyclohydrolase|uniref:Phosphoribosyl-AMP cyclohydrolase n=1 Tax=Henriciella pelagia TaxID=1977912 RepID=A0ABQ1JL92_9PROT|nr:phosphoribosyl-AMP cyclohydrolase [Henriciella pelagia]GGB69123.1 phosphoribosyl-AMP cyclohydrolase [Henriciella pelagia]
MTEFFPPLSGKDQDETDELRPKFDADGLIAAVSQDADTGEVLMLAWMNDKALQQSIETGLATYWSRSRQKLWVKGETSDSLQRIVEIRVDCDQDAVVMKVRKDGPACHTGREACFYRTINPDGRTLSKS